MTRARIVWVFIFFLVLASCARGPRTPLPRGLAKDSVLSEEQMVNLLVDIHILEATLQFQRNRNSDIRQGIVSSYSGIFSRYGTSERRFRLNLDYYRSDGAEFNRIYDQVVKEIDKRKNALKP